MAEEPRTSGQPPEQPASKPEPAGDEVEQAKATVWLAYLGILFLIPLLTLKDNEYAKFHVKQGIVLSIYWVAVIILGSVIPFLGWFVILPIGSILVMVFEIIGIVKSLQGSRWQCPLGVYQLAMKFKF
ncbi:MAG: hypothetical protein JSU73_04600 [candidate division WOR-3 bacterium]|nr:MAG: hypothetical protein JSU73_04600 [candidate division WOR-3 bacterium]